MKIIIDKRIPKETLVKLIDDMYNDSLCNYENISVFNAKLNLSYTINVGKKNKVLTILSNLK